MTRPGNGSRPVAADDFEDPFLSDPGRTAPRMNEGTATSAPARIPIALVRWKSGKLHVTPDGIKTGCGALIPATATVTQALGWCPHTNCYNYAYRLWGSQGPAEYLPVPEQRLRLPAAAPRPALCTAAAPTRPATTRLLRYSTYTVFPERRPDGPDGRCAEGCESTEKVMRRANLGMFFDLTISVSIAPYQCGGAVCADCQTRPVPGMPLVCNPRTDAHLAGAVITRERGPGAGDPVTASPSTWMPSCHPARTARAVGGEPGPHRAGRVRRPSRRRRRADQRHGAAGPLHRARAPSRVHSARKQASLAAFLRCATATDSSTPTQWTCSTGPRSPKPHPRR